MTSYLPYDIQSLLPRSGGPPVAALPSHGAPAPGLPGVRFSRPTCVAFVRHCGCPFAEAEVRSLRAVAQAHDDLEIIVIAHSDEGVAQEWFRSVGGDDFPSSRVTLLADPSRELYAAWGLGALPLTGLFSWAMVGELRALASQGIKNRRTGAGSWRWQNSGGFVVDAQGKVRWHKVATHAGDTVDYAAALKSAGV